MPIARLREFARSHREAHAARLAIYEQAWKDDTPHDSFTRETLRLGIDYERMVLRWVDSLPWMTERKRTKKG